VEPPISALLFALLLLIGMLLLLEIGRRYGVGAVRKSRKASGAVLARSRGRFSPCLV